MFMKKTILLIFLVTSLSGFSQENIITNFYFDENNKQVGILDYFDKCSSFLYECNKEEKENSVFNTMTEIYKFGKLSKTETSQIQKLLSRNTNRDLTNKTIIITYRDLLYGPNASELKGNLSFDKHYTFPMKGSKYKLIRKKNDSKHRKCIQKFNKKGVAALYFYNLSIDYSYVPKHYKWHKISTIIQSTFFNEKSPSILILKSDGNYFRYTSNYSEDLLNNLITKDWTSYLKDYKVAKLNLPNNPIGFFKQMKPNHSNCNEVFFIDNNPNITREQKREFIQSKSEEVIVVKSRNEISKYLSHKQPCFSYPSF